MEGEIVVVARSLCQKGMYFGVGFALWAMVNLSQMLVFPGAGVASTLDGFLVGAFLEF